MFLCVCPSRCLIQKCAPPPPRRRTAAADHNWLARCRRRPNVGVAPATFSWSVHVTLYNSYMFLDLCNAVQNESSTLTKSSKNDAGVFCNNPWYSNETQQRQSKVFHGPLRLQNDLYCVGGALNSTHSLTFVDHFVKMKVDAKNFVWNFFAHLVNKADGTLKDFNSVYCNNCL